MTPPFLRLDVVWWSSVFRDAFRAAGNGISRTFNRDAMYVRIDHVLADPTFVPVEAHVDNGVDLSDHYPLIATFRRSQP